MDIVIFNKEPILAQDTSGQNLEKRTVSGGWSLRSGGWLVKLAQAWCEIIVHDPVGRRMHLPMRDCWIPIGANSRADEVQAYPDIDQLWLLARYGITAIERRPRSTYAVDWKSGHRGDEFEYLWPLTNGVARVEQFPGADETEIQRQLRGVDYAGLTWRITDARWAIICTAKATREESVFGLRLAVYDESATLISLIPEIEAYLAETGYRWLGECLNPLLYGW